jgi:hypothetical protein
VSSKNPFRASETNDAVASGEVAWSSRIENEPQLV